MIKLVSSWLWSLWEVLAIPLSHPSIRLAVLAVLLVDVALLGLFLAWAMVEHYQLKESFLYGRLVFSAQDRSLLESFGYLKELAACAILLVVFRQTRAPLYLSIAILVAALLLDDALELHETIGRQFIVTGMPSSIAQAVAAALLGLVPSALILYHWSKAEAGTRRNGEAVLFAVGILLFFGVAVDAAHEVLQKTIGGYETISSLIEDGGELVSLTLLVLASVGVYLRVSGWRRGLKHQTRQRAGR